MIGRVVSVKNQKTANVLVERVAVSPLYGKTFTRSKKYLVDDSIGVKLGDMVEIINCRPVSKRKTMRIVKVLGRSLAEIMEEKLKASAEAAIAEVMPETSELVDQSVSVSEKQAEKANDVPKHRSTDKPKKEKK